MGVAEIDDEWLRATDLKAEYGIPERTWSQWRYLGKGPRFYRLGGHVLYRRSDVAAWAEGQAVETTRRR